MANLDSILKSLGLSERDRDYPNLIRVLQDYNLVTADEHNNIINVSVKPLPNVIRNQADMLKTRMVGIVSDENFGVTAVLNRRIALIQSIIELLKEMIENNSNQFDEYYKKGETHDVIRTDVGGGNVTAKYAQFATHYRDETGFEFSLKGLKQELEDVLAYYNSQSLLNAEFITDEEYEQLPDEAKQEDIAYFIDDGKKYYDTVEIDDKVKTINENIAGVDDKVDALDSYTKEEISNVNTRITENVSRIDANIGTINEALPTFANINVVEQHIQNSYTKSEIDDKLAKVGENLVFDTENLTSVELGGIPKGTSLNGKSIEAIIEMLLFPFSIRISSVSPSGTYEKGDTVKITSVTVGITMGSRTIQSLKLYKSDKTTLLGEKTSGIGTSNTFTLTSPLETGTSITFYAEASDGTETKTTSNSFLSFYDATYYGVLDSGYTLSSGLITGKTKTLKSSKNNAFSFNADGQHPFVAYPASYGELSSIKDGNGFECIGDFAKTSITINKVSYYVYVTKSITTGNYTYEFK
jgi:hypothetical protein